MDSLSTPRVGIHALRIPIIDVAAIDTIGTIVGGYGISKIMNWSFATTTASLFGIGLAFHHFYNIDTTMHRKFMELIGSEIPVNHPQITDASDSTKCPMEHLWKNNN